MPLPPRIYLDNNATTPMLPAVFDAMRPYFLEAFGNASSTHQQGQHARAAIDRSRDQVARLLGCRASEIVFTSGGTESDNLALFGTVHAGQHLITTSTEHHAVLHAAQSLEKRGVSVTFLDCNGTGLVDLAALKSALRPNTALVSVLFANNETGVIQPIAELAGIAKAHGALFHTDAVQAVGKIPIDLAGEFREVDLLTLSGHKLHAPQGVGALFVRRRTSLEPLLHGGPHERQRRAGTENVPGIVALGAACELLAFEDRTRMLRDQLESTLLDAILDSGVNGSTEHRIGNTSNLYFEGVDSEALLIALDLAGISVSAGSACQSGATTPSHVLLAMGLTPERARASIRFSLSRLNTEEQIERACAIIPAAVARLRSFKRTPSA